MKKLIFRVQCFNFFHVSFNYILLYLIFQFFSLIFSFSLAVDFVFALIWHVLSFSFSFSVSCDNFRLFNALSFTSKAILEFRHALLYFKISLNHQWVLLCFEAPCSDPFAIFPLRHPSKCSCFALLLGQTVYLTISFLLMRAFFFLHKDLTLKQWNNAFAFLFPNNWRCLNFFHEFCQFIIFLWSIIHFYENIIFALYLSFHMIEQSYFLISCFNWIISEEITIPRCLFQQCLLQTFPCDCWIGEVYVPS